MVLHIEALEIDEHILTKVESQHGVAFFEIEEACFSERQHVRRATEGVYKVFARTEAGRYLLIVLADHLGGRWKVVTAREMTDPEQRLYHRLVG